MQALAHGRKQLAYRASIFRSTFAVTFLIRHVPCPMSHPRLSAARRLFDDKLSHVYRTRHTRTGDKLIEPHSASCPVRSSVLLYCTDIAHAPLPSMARPSTINLSLDSRTCAAPIPFQLCDSIIHVLSMRLLQLMTLEHCLRCMYSGFLANRESRRAGSTQLSNGIAVDAWPHCLPITGSSPTSCHVARNGRHSVGLPCRARSSGREPLARPWPCTSPPDQRAKRE